MNTINPVYEAQAYKQTSCKKKYQSFIFHLFSLVALKISKFVFGKRKEKRPEQAPKTFESSVKASMTNLTPVPKKNSKEKIMNTSNFKSIACLFFLSTLFMIMFPYCSKTSNSKVLEKVDTVKYLRLYNGSYPWCVTATVPPYNSIIAAPGEIGINSAATGFSHYQCGGTNNDTITFIVNKYKNTAINLVMWGARQDIGGIPPDSLMTLSIYLNNIIVATQTSATKDSVHYIIN